MKEITNNTEFIIGIDFGHGETSAAFCDLRTGECKDIDILPGKDCIKSAVAILEQEGKLTICVGETAINNAAYAKEFQISFKKLPSEMSQHERRIMVSFMKGVYQDILERHPDYKQRDHGVFIARPSNDGVWRKEEKAYLKMAEDAGLPIVGIQKESRAAYFRARTQPDTMIDEQVDNGVLIVDFGSSTIDFTYLNKNLNEPIDYGVNLGANEVETLLLRYALSHPQDSNMNNFNEFFGKHPDSNAYNQMLYQFRKAKEEFYGGKSYSFSFSFNYEPITASAPVEQQIIGFGGIALTKEKVNEILTGYIYDVEEAVKDFKKNKLGENIVAGVYLTGGASRMDFVRGIFMRVFNLNDSACPSDDKPSVIVSQGIAKLSYADIKTEGRKSELEKKAKQIIENFDWNKILTGIIYSEVKCDIIKKCKEIMQLYKDDEVFEYVEMKNSIGIKDGKYYDMEVGQTTTGNIRVRNIRSLCSKFTQVFKDYQNYDFMENCKSVINKTIIDSVVKEMQETFSAYDYKYDNRTDIPIKLSVRLSPEGSDILNAKFTSGGKGHILYDAVSSRYGGIMNGWNLWKDRGLDSRKWHYSYYIKNNLNIFAPDPIDFNVGPGLFTLGILLSTFDMLQKTFSLPNTWGRFLNDNISIDGLETTKEEVKSYVQNMIDDFISYAKLSIFFK